MKEIFTDIIKYWETRRIVYNIGLIAIVVIVFFIGLPYSKEKLDITLFLHLFWLAVVANVLYTTAYVVDVFVQISAFTTVWKKYRWGLFIIGFLFAVINAWFVSTGLFGLNSF